MQILAPSFVHADPLAGVPFGHAHVLPTQAVPTNLYPALHDPQWLTVVLDLAAIKAPLAHVPAALHSRSDVAVGGFDSYCVALHVAEVVAQIRSVVGVGCVFSYSPLLQTVHLTHDLSGARK